MIGGHFETQFDCFVISLKRTPDRLQTFLAQNAKCEIAFQLFEAIDGTQIDTADIEGRIVAKNAMGYTRGIIGTQCRIWLSGAVARNKANIMSCSRMMRLLAAISKRGCSQQSANWPHGMLSFWATIPTPPLKSVLRRAFPSAAVFRSSIRRQSICRILPIRPTQSPCIDLTWRWDFVATSYRQAARTFSRKAAFRWTTGQCTMPQPVTSFGLTASIASWRQSIRTYPRMSALLRSQ